MYPTNVKKTVISIKNHHKTIRKKVALFKNINLCSCVRHINSHIQVNNYKQILTDQIFILLKQFSN